MTDTKAPERIWADDVEGRSWEYGYVHDLQVEYIRKDLYDALANERDELQAEVENLRVAARMARARTTDSAVAYALDTALQRKQRDE